MIEDANDCMQEMQSMDMNVLWFQSFLTLWTTITKTKTMTHTMTIPDAGRLPFFQTNRLSATYRTDGSHKNLNFS